LESTGDGDGATDTDDVGFGLTDADAVAPGEEEDPEPVPPAECADGPLALGVGEAPPPPVPGLLAEVVYVLPSAAKVMKVYISGCEVPVRLAPEKQITANSIVPPLGTRATVWISEIGSSSVPWNAEVTLLVAAEILKVCPLARTARKTAEPWNPVAHAVVVDQVGLLLPWPLAGFSATAPGFVPRTAGTACAACAAHIPSDVPPATTAPANHAPIERRPLLLTTGSLPPTCRAGPSSFVKKEDAPFEGRRITIYHGLCGLIVIKVPFH
jgi:hypothetical protein